MKERNKITMKELKNEFFAFLDNARQNALEEAETLTKDDRKDEGNILKAKDNINDIFKAIWNAADGMADDKESFCEAFRKTAEMIPSAWVTSLEKAKEHNDTHKILIEEAKLSAVSEIKDKFNSLFA